MTPVKETGVIVTSSGRPVERFPLFILRRESGKWFNLLSRIDVSDVGNDTVAEAFYSPLVVIERDNQMTTVEIRIVRHAVVIFFAPRKVSWHVFNTNIQQDEQ